MNDENKLFETRAFLRGFDYGVEQTINAHDPLLGVLTQFEWATREWIEQADDDDERAEVKASLDALDAQVHAVMAAVRRVRENGAHESLPLFRVEVNS